jgi:hypothetical protein
MMRHECILLIIRWNEAGMDVYKRHLSICLGSWLLSRGDYSWTRTCMAFLAMMRQACVLADYCIKSETGIDEYMCVLSVCMRFVSLGPAETPQG